MATETETMTGQCSVHGKVEATRDIPKMGFPFLLYTYLRSRARRKPFLCPECGVKGHQELPSGGHEFCPLMATRSARWWPSDVAGWWLVQGDHSLPGEGLGEPDAVAAGLADVGVVHQPVDGGGGQGLGHQLVERGRVQVGADRNAASFVCGID